MKFLKKIEILPNESITSILYRLAEANYYQGPKIIADFLHMNMYTIDSNNFSRKQCEKILSFINKTPADLYARSTVCHTKDNDLLVMRSRVKFCPACIKDTPHHQWLWNFTVVNICLKHSIILVDKCPKCFEKISVKALLKRTCRKCSFPFNNTSPKNIKEDSLLYKSQNDMYNRIFHKPIEILSELSLEKYIQFAKEILVIFEDQNSFTASTETKVHSFRKVKGGNYFNNEDLAHALCNVYWLLTDINENLPKVLNGFEKLNYSKRKRRMLQFKKLLQSNEGSYLQNAYNTFRQQQIEEGNTSRNVASYDKKSALKIKDKYYVKRELPKVLNISLEKLNDLIQKKLLEPKKVSRGKAVHYLFNKHEVEHLMKQIKTEKEDAIGYYEAKDMLGVSFESVKELVKKEILTEKEYVWRSEKCLSRTEIKAILCNVGNVTFDINLSEYISLKDVLDKYKTSGISIPLLLQSIRNNKLRPRTNVTNANITNFFFRISEIKSVLEAIKRKNQNQKGYHFIDITKMMNISDRTLHKLIECKLLEQPEKTISPKGRTLYWFPKKVVDDFCSTYITVREAEKEYGIPQGRVRKLVYQGHVRNYLEGVCRKMLLNRNELELVLEQM
ncbi:putative metalloprotease [Bacillus tianshenii]|uniref:Metalloprotease n=1 Tax=Sutcliffiella tianshenii TaxID=1463404 RepID=A0ABS2NZX3_9BACI|nr:TniQ family protein [Bacillus tianshenii]MBM7620164.1 putative metalloprotease [Bacillus tianshenii]